MKSARKKNFMGIVLFVIISCFCTPIWAGVPSIIKVGLESSYKNTSSVKVQSDSNLQIGYYDENGFTSEGTLKTNQVTISLGSSNYYDLGVSFNNYEEAYNYALSCGGIPIHLERNKYGVYSANSSGGYEKGQAFKRCLNIYDASGNLILISNEDKNQIVFRGYDTATGFNLTTINNKKYRGAIGMGGTTGLTPYNIVDLEAYLYGVVPKEMPASWPAEALKAQAVAARSIATYQYNRYASSGYNVVDTTTTQVYGGYTAETVATNDAVNATKGQVIYYNGKIAEALYFSTSGGMTESAQNVWGSDITYLRSVADTYETEPEQKPWTRTITLSDLDKCLASYGANVGKAQGIQVVSRTSSGRVQELNILGSSGKYAVKGETIRSFFSSSNGGSLKSRLFTFNNTAITTTAQETAKNITVLSANGLQEVSGGNLVAISKTGTSTLTNSIVVQSATTTTTLNTAEKVTQAVASTNETVWGDFTIYGQGFGHGVGMSQSGAKGMAKAGYTYDEILKHYYTGVTVE